MQYIQAARTNQVHPLPKQPSVSAVDLTESMILRLAPCSPHGFEPAAGMNAAHPYTQSLSVLACHPLLRSGKDYICTLLGLSSKNVTEIALVRKAMHELIRNKISRLEI